MTETATSRPLPTGQPAPGPVSGADLARTMLQAARQAAKQHGTNPSPARRTVRRSAPRRGEGRDPITFMAAVAGLLESRGWEAPAAGGSVIDQWPQIAPELEGKARAVGYQPATGVLELAASSPAYATNLRLLEQQLVDRINTHLRDHRAGPEPGRTSRGAEPPGPVRSLHITQDTRPSRGPNHQVQAAPAAPRQPADDTPPRTRETASPGYHRALTAHQTKHQQRDDPLPPAVEAAIEAHDQALRRCREPEQDFADARELAEQRQARARAVADPRVRALARARAEKTADAGPRRVPPRRAAAPARPGT